MSQSRICGYCGDRFTARSVTQKFCSTLCGKLKRARISIEDVCENCAHPRASHFSAQGVCSVVIAGVQCKCAHFRYKRLD